MIRAYTGLFGTGKTLSMVNDGLQMVRAGRRVFTNIPFANKKTGWFDRNYKRQPFFVTTEELENLILIEDNAVFLVDEGNIVFSSYYWKNMKPEFLIRLAQTRHHHLDIYYTTQGFTHVAARLRELTNELVFCEHKGFFGASFFINTCYDPLRYSQTFLNPFQEKSARIWTKRIYWKRAKYIFKCYDTLRDVGSSSMMGVKENSYLQLKERVLAEHPSLLRFYNSSGSVTSIL